METKFDTKSGTFIHFENKAYCPRCSNVIPQNQLACLGCVPGVNAPAKKGKRKKPQPDQDSLFAGVPGVRV